MSPTKKSLATTAALAGAALLLSGCSVIDQFRPLPDEQKYQNIEPVKEALDIHTAGTVLEEYYDIGGGGIQASYYRASIKGEGVLDALIERIQTMKGAECREPSPTGIRCRVGYAEVSIGIPNQQDPPIVEIQVLDSSSGRLTK